MRLHSPVLPSLKIDRNKIGQVSVEVQTLDHLGMLKEVKNIGVDPDFKDIITIKQYDGLGNESINYLPSIKKRKVQSNLTGLLLFNLLHKNKSSLWCG